MSGEKVPETVDEYLCGLPPEAKQKLDGLRSFFKSRCPPETLEKISWGMPTLYLNGNLIQYAAFKDHYSVFPGSAVLDALSDIADEYRTGKGTLRFSYDAPLNAPLLAKIIEIRVGENRAKKTKKRAS